MYCITSSAEVRERDKRKTFGVDLSFPLVSNLQDNNDYYNVKTAGGEKFGFVSNDKSIGVNNFEVLRLKIRF